MRCVESTSALVDVAIPHLLDVPSKALERLTLRPVHPCNYQLASGDVDAPPPLFNRFANWRSCQVFPTLTMRKYIPLTVHQIVMTTRLCWEALPLETAHAVA
ncbi:unnamed protein product [Mesocestoides corti]|uniref:Uncharacterized protein n=1 Tax=Mesocestoides corti TaxID=53468 RepID=A0A0R3UBD7_MESCO|nr:unnamed protein product [Mesocestoides corti]